MSDNHTLDFVLERVNDKGWLSISTLYFDNAYAINIFSTRVYVAYSPSKGLFFNFSCLDSTESAVIEGTYATLDAHDLGLQQNITVTGDEHLQHFDLAQYSHYSFYNDNQDATPYPAIPTPAQIEALEINEETKLYPGTDTIGLLDKSMVSAIGMYQAPYNYSGALITGWKRFYRNQKKMVALLSSAYGITDAI